MHEEGPPLADSCTLSHQVVVPVFKAAAALCLHVQAWLFDIHRDSADLPNPKMSIFLHKSPSYSGNFNSGMPGDNINAFLHCGDVSAPDVDASSVIKSMTCIECTQAFKTSTHQF